MERRIVLKADNQASGAINEVGQSINEVTQSINEAGQIINEAGQGINEVGQNINEVTQSLNEITQSINETGQAADQGASKLDRFIGRMQELVQQQKEMARRMPGSAAQINTLTDGLREELSEIDPRRTIDGVSRRRTASSVFRQGINDFREEIRAAEDERQFMERQAAVNQGSEDFQSGFSVRENVSEAWEDLTSKAEEAGKAASEMVQTLQQGVAQRQEATKEELTGLKDAARGRYDERLMQARGNREKESLAKVSFEEEKRRIRELENLRKEEAEQFDELLDAKVKELEVPEDDRKDDDPKGAMGAIATSIQTAGGVGRAGIGALGQTLIQGSMGALIGSAFSGAGSIAGAAGGMVGGALGGPLGAVTGSMLGSLVGAIGNAAGGVVQRAVDESNQIEQQEVRLAGFIGRGNVQDGVGKYDNDLAASTSRYNMSRMQARIDAARELTGEKMPGDMGDAFALGRADAITFAAGEMGFQRDILPYLGEKQAGLDKAEQDRQAEIARIEADSKGRFSGLGMKQADAFALQEQLARASGFGRGDLGGRGLEDRAFQNLQVSRAYNIDSSQIMQGDQFARYGSGTGAVNIERLARVFNQTFKGDFTRLAEYQQENNSLMAKQLEAGESVDSAAAMGQAAAFGVLGGKFENPQQRMGLMDQIDQVMKNPGNDFIRSSNMRAIQQTAAAKEMALSLSDVLSIERGGLSGNYKGISGMDVFETDLANMQTAGDKETAKLNMLTKYKGIDPNSLDRLVDGDVGAMTEIRKQVQSQASGIGGLSGFTQERARENVGTQQRFSAEIADTLGKGAGKAIVSEFGPLINPLIGVLKDVSGGLAGLVKKMGDFVTSNDIFGGTDNQK